MRLSWYPAEEGVLRSGRPHRVQQQGDRRLRPRTRHRPVRVRSAAGRPAVTGPPGPSPSIILLTLARRIETELGAALAPLGLTVGRLGLLGHISGVPGVSFSDLARMSGTTVQTAHGAVKALVTAGLVHDRTARAGAASAIELTPEGQRLLAAAREAVAQVDVTLFGPEADPIQQRVAATVRAAFGDAFPAG